MTVHQLVGKLGIPRYGDEGGIVAPRGMGVEATKLYNKVWGKGTVVEMPHPTDGSMATYTLVT